MIGWIIFGAILLILIFLLTRSVKVTAIYDSHPEVSVKLMCFTLYKIPEDPKTAEKKKRKQEKKAAREQKKQAAKLRKSGGNGKSEIAVKSPTDNTESEVADESKKEDNEKTGGKKAKKTQKQSKQKKKFDLDFEMIMDYVRSASPPVKRLFKKIRIRDVYIDWVVGSDEAGKTALKYGGLCTAFYSLQEWLTTYFDARIKEINIEADFSAEKDDIFAYITLKLRICTALGCVLWLGVRMLKTYLKYNGKQKNTKVKMKPAASR